MSPKIVDKEAKKMHIVHAALHAFSKKGIVKTKMSDIAEMAGVGKGTIYEYFRSKEDIFATAFTSMFGGMMQTMQRAIEQAANPKEKLEKIIEITLDYFGHDAAEFAGIMMDFWAEGIRSKNEKVLEIINLKKIYEDYRQLISAIVDQGIKEGIFKKVNPQAFGAICIAALDGLFLQLIMDPAVINLKEIKKTFNETLIAGLEK